MTRFRLYVLGGAPHDRRAVANFCAIANERLGDSYELDVVDVAEEPLRALSDGVLLTPTLVRLTPPIRRILGDLSDTNLVLMALDMPNLGDDAPDSEKRTDKSVGK